MKTDFVRVFRVRLSLALGASAIAAACGSSSEPKVPPDVTPATITAASTDTIRGVVGAAAGTQLTVTVKNKSGEPLDTTVVTFSVATGGGSVSAGSARTNSSGQASTTWTLGPTAGVQTVTARVGSLSPVTFVATAAAGPVAKITKVAGDAQSAAVGATVPVAPSVKVSDAFDNPLAGQLVSFSVASGGGVVTGGALNSNAQGIATVGSWKLGGAVGSNTLVAQVGNVSTTFTATGTVGAPATITLTPNTIGQLTVGQTVTVTAQVVDAVGNPIPNPTVTYTTSDNTIASVTSAGVITAVGAGTATITASVGTATASVAVTVIGHPAGSTITNTITFNAFPGDVAFTNSLMLIAANTAQQVLIFDQSGTTQKGTIKLSTPVPILLAPTHAAGPVVAINVGTTSRLWFIDPNAAAVTDSLDIPDAIQTAVMNSTGTRIYSLLSAGMLSVVDGSSHSQIGSITLGGGVTKLMIVPGDTLMYALTNVGVIFQIDLRTNTVLRQIISNAAANATDVALSPDGTKFFVLDGNASVVRIVDIASNTTVRTVGVSAAGTTLSVSPDGQQIWVTHSFPARITIYTGSIANGYLSTGSIPTNNGSLPLRVYLSPSGSTAAITNFGGWVDIVR